VTLMKASLSIGQVAAATGLRTSAIRYYEDTGILPKPERVSGQRRYQGDTNGAGGFTHPSRKP
jgi:MerR family regulatory protein